MTYSAGLDSYHIHFIKTYPEATNITSSIYVEIIGGFFKFLIKKMLDGYDVDLPCILGRIMIRGEKPRPYFDNNRDFRIKGLPIDWKKTVEHWKKEADILGISYMEYKKKPLSERIFVYHFNEHSDGIVYRAVFIPGRGKVVNKTYYSLKFSKCVNKVLALNIKNGKEYLTS